jgi:alanyl-tRNA synthetase
MTERLYYHDSNLHEFEGTVKTVTSGDKPAVHLDRTAFYPTSGGQVFDQGKLVTSGGEVRVEQVEENESGEIVHYISPADVSKVQPGEKVRGFVDHLRRRDHMQQHSGQHVLSAAFVRLFNMATVSFHMGVESCTIDLATQNLTEQQIEKSEELANRIVFENRPVKIRFVSMEEAKGLGLRKLPAVGRDELRLIDIADFDLCACGGTHVRSTGEVGAVLVRKSERVKQGFRVEFVAGDRALKTARRDFKTLTEAAALYSANIWELPAVIRKSLDDVKAANKQQHRLLEELAELSAEKLLHEAISGSQFKLVKQTYPDREVAFVKLLAQKLAQHKGVVALLASTAGQPTLVFSRSLDVDVDVNLLMKEALRQAGGRGGGSKDLAQGGVPDPARIPECLDLVAFRLPA